MKKLALAILPLILISCTNRSGNSGNKLNPKSYKQITFLLDTIADIYVFNELKNISDVNLNEEGEIKSAIQTNFSFKNQEGSKEESINIYSPILCWSFSGDSIPILLKYYKQALTDTIINEGEYTFQYNEYSRLISFIYGYGPDNPLVIFDFQYDLDGQWTQISKRFRDERSGHSYYEITTREFLSNDEPITTFDSTYLTVNGENIFNKQRGIVEYYVLLRKAGIFIPDNAGGIFDEPNGFFENEDEGTGAGTYTSQLTGWRTSDGKDIIGINGFYRDPGGSFPITGGDPPAFYLFENNSFTKLKNVFPEVNANLFFDRDTGSTEGIQTYFTLPREGEFIQYNLGLPIDFLRENYNDYKEICDKYSDIKRTSIEIEFDPIIGNFHVSN